MSLNTKDIKKETEQVTAWVTEDSMREFEEQTKYYTPTIEEFHVGFEYEELDPDYQGQSDGKQWKSIKLSKEGLISIATNWKYFQEYRVKYLDREDIESLGFEYKRTIKCLQFSDGMNSLAFYLNGTGSYNGINNIQITSFGKSILFRGLVKNKSELKRILKQIGI
jgi:hypothetical protein